MSLFYKPAEEAPCKLACPAGIDVPRYIRHISKGEFDEALAVIRDTFAPILAKLNAGVT